MEGGDGGYLSAVKVAVPGYNCYKYPPLEPRSRSVVSFTCERHQAEAINVCFGVLSAVVTSGVNLSPNSTQTRSRCL